VKPNLTETEATYTTNWFVNPRPNPGAKTRLATLPPARDGVLRVFDSYVTSRIETESFL